MHTILSDKVKSHVQGVCSKRCFTVIYHHSNVIQMHKYLDAYKLQFYPINYANIVWSLFLFCCFVYGSFGCCRFFGVYLFFFNLPRESASSERDGENELLFACTLFTLRILYTRHAASEFCKQMQRKKEIAKWRRIWRCQSIQWVSKRTLEIERI